MSKAHLHYSFATLGSARIYTLKIVVLPFIKLEYGPGYQLYGNSVNFWNKGLVSRNNNPLLLRQASICKNQGFEARNDKPLSFLGGLTSKGQVGVLLGEHRGWILRMAFDELALIFPAVGQSSFSFFLYLLLTFFSSFLPSVLPFFWLWEKERTAG